MKLFVLAKKYKRFGILDKTLFKRGMENKDDNIDKYEH